MSQSELSYIFDELLDAAVTARVTREATKHGKLRASTGHPKPTEFRILMQLVEERWQWLEYAEANGEYQGQDPEGFFPISYASLREKVLPTRKDATSPVLTNKAVSRAMKGLEEAGLIQRRRGGDRDKYFYRLELDRAETREPHDGAAARHDVRVMMSEAHLGVMPLTIMAQLRYLAREGRLVLDKTQIEEETGCSHKTVKTTLEALLPEKLGICVGLGSFGVSGRVFELEFRTVDVVDLCWPTFVDRAPLTLVGFPDPAANSGSSTPIEDDDPTLDISFESPRSDDLSAAELEKAGGVDVPDTDGNPADDLRGFSPTTSTPSSVSSTPAPRLDLPLSADVDDEPGYTVYGEMPEDPDWEAEMAELELPDELIG